MSIREMINCNYYINFVEPYSVIPSYSCTAGYSVIIA